MGLKQEFEHLPKAVCLKAIANSIKQALKAIDVYALYLSGVLSAKF